MPSKYNVRAEKITTESSDSKSFIFTPIDNDEGLYDYLPGQFFMVEAKITRPESIVYDKESKQMIPSGPDVEVVEKKAYSVVSSPTQKGHHPLSDDGPWMLSVSGVWHIIRLRPTQWRRPR